MPRSTCVMAPELPPVRNTSERMRMATDSDLARNVEYGYGLGWSLTPLAGKRPIAAAWQSEPRETLEQALKWTAEGNVGLRTGQASGVIVIDADIQKGADIAPLDLPGTVTGCTGGGGMHLFYLCTKPLGNSVGKLGRFIDVRADGGQVVFPGSVHPDTHEVYAWAEGSEPWTIAVAELPDRIYGLLVAPGRPVDAPDDADDRPELPAQHAKAPVRSHRPLHPSRYAEVSLQLEVHNVATAQEGTRNDALNKAGFSLGTLVGAGLLDRARVEAELTAAALSAGLDEREIQATIRSGLDSGVKQPRTVNLAVRKTARPAMSADMPGGETEDTDEADAEIIEYPDPIPLAEHYLVYARTTRLLRWRGQFYSYTGTHYAELPEEALDCELYRHLDTLWTRDKSKDAVEGDLVKVVPKVMLVREVRLALPSRDHIRLDDAVGVPSWLDGRAQPLASGLVAFSNGLLELSSGVLHPASDSYFCTNAVDFGYDADAPNPDAWCRFLDDLFSDDQQSKDALQELFGYFLSPDTSQHKIGLIVGPKRSGKGTIARVLSAMLGASNVCGPTLGSLGMDFGLQPLVNKRLAIISDARLGNRSDQARIVETLLSVSGEDVLTVPRKYLTEWTGRLPTRFLILTNELPRLNDTSGALAGRFILLCLTRSWFGNEDIGLTDKLVAELPGIVKWSVEGYRRLQQRGRFVMPETSAAALQELEDLASPVTAFIRDCCEAGPALSIEANRLFEAWKEYCRSTGRGHAGTRQAFGRDLRAVMPALRVAQPRVLGETRVRQYHGIDLKL